MENSPPQLHIDDLVRKRKRVLVDSGGGMLMSPVAPFKHAPKHARRDTGAK